MIENTLRPYQLEVASAVWNSICQNLGLTFTVEIARQGGKNELSAWLESFLLFNYFDQSKNLVKCAPTFNPQALISFNRLKDKLDQSDFSGSWTSEHGHIIRFGNARAVFLSAARTANVVGNTAHLLLEVDEAQDVDEDKFFKEFLPMCNSTNATVVLYGTPWDDNSLLEKMKRINQEQEKTGPRRHFSFDWQHVGAFSEPYLRSALAVKDTLGENHPAFQTQYCLVPVHGIGGFLNPTQKAQLQGTHARRRSPEFGKIYVAGIDLAGESENSEDDFLHSISPRQDSTVITLAEVTFVPSCDPCVGARPPVSPVPISIVGARHAVPTMADSRIGISPVIPSPVIASPLASRSNLKPSEDSLYVGINKDGSHSSVPSLVMLESAVADEASQCGAAPLPVIPAQAGIHSSPSPLPKSPSLRIVEHYSWTGVRHADLYPKLVDLLKNVWNCKRVVVDSTGIGQPVASFLRQALGSRVIPFEFTARSKTDLAFNLLSAVNSGNLKMYAADNSPEYQEFWFEMDHARSSYRLNRTMNFYVDPSQGHDDYLMSLALLVEAANHYVPREAKGR